MTKLVLLICIAFLATLAMAQIQDKPCKPGGRICSEDSECCAGLICNPWAGRCTKPKPPKPTTTTAAPTSGPSSTTGSPSSTGSPSTTGYPATSVTPTASVPSTTACTSATPIPTSTSTAEGQSKI